MIITILCIVSSNAQWEQCNNGLYGGNIIAGVVKDNIIFVANQDNGVFSSTDFGLNWIEKNNGLDKRTVISLAACGNTLIAGTFYDGYYLSSDNGSNWIHKEGMNSIYYVNSLAVKGNNIYAGTSNGVYLSTDYGETWMERDTGIAINSINTIVVSGDNIYAGTNGDGVYISTDNGDTWIKKSSGVEKWVNKLTANGNYVAACTNNNIYISSNNGDSWINKSDLLGSNSRFLIIIGDSIFATSYYGFYLSTDFGNNWQKIHYPKTFPGINTIFRSGNNLLIGGNGGIAVSTDNGINWEKRNHGLTCMDLTAITAYNNTIYVGSRIYGLHYSTDNGNSWQGNDTLIADINSIVYSGGNIIESSVRNNVAGEGYGMFQSSDNGTSWSNVHAGLLSDNIRGLAVADNYVFAISDSGVFRSSNNGRSWYHKTSGLYINAYGVAANGRNVFVGSDSGIYRSTDYGESWSQVYSSPYGVSKITATGSHLIAVALYSTPNLLQSSDNGDTWTDVTQNIPQYYSTTTLVSFGDYIFTGCDRLFASTDIGILLTTDFENSWSLQNNGLTNRNIEDITVCGDYVFAATRGGGVFRAKISDLIITDVPETKPEKSVLIISPNPATDHININVGVHCNEPLQNEILIYNIFGELVMSCRGEVTSTLRIDVSGLSPGVYFLKVGNKTKMFIKQ
jgi:photosystem II stability/assembly factor-like uncharacterized protein